MPVYPKYYLADVPNELRRQVLDLCCRFQWQEARNLLLQNGFSQYTLRDVHDFYGYAPTVIETPEPPPHLSEPQPPPETVQSTCEPPGAMTDSTETTASDHLASAATAHQPAISPAHPEPVAEPAPSQENVAPAPSVAASPAETPDGVLEDKNAAPPPDPPKIPHKRRSKFLALPAEIREQVNLFLDEEKEYGEILKWLEERGYPDFNKVNLHNWRAGGYQDWRREQERLEAQQMKIEWLTDVARGHQPGELNHIIMQLLCSHILDSLFGLDTAKLKESLAGQPKHLASLIHSFCRINRQIQDTEAFRRFLEHEQDVQKAKKGGGISRETLEAITRELRLVVPFCREAVEKAEAAAQDVKPG